MDYERARRHLRRRDPVMAGLIARVGPCRLAGASARDPFATLTRSIASQQLSAKAADTIYSRFRDLFEGRVPTPKALLGLDDARIRAAGFSGSKIGFLRDLSARVTDGRLDLASLGALSDDEALAALVAVKGIGRWTAEIFLMFRLERPDLLPTDDVGLMRAIRRAYRLRVAPSAARLRAISEPWRPYRTVASWYLWQSLELPPPEAVTSRPRSASPARGSRSRPARRA